MPIRSLTDIIGLRMVLIVIEIRRTKPFTVSQTGILAVELYVNGCLAGRQEEPERGGFVFAFPHIDVTQSPGFIEAVGYDTRRDADSPVSDRNSGQGRRICLEAHTAGEGLLASRTDIAYVDVSVVDAREGSVLWRIAGLRFPWRERVYF